MRLECLEYSLLVIFKRITKIVTEIIVKIDILQKQAQLTAKLILFTTP